MDLSIERPNSQYGSAIFVRSGTILNTTSLTDISNIEILRVDLNGISVTSVYKPPGERFSFHQTLTAVVDQQQSAGDHWGIQQPQFDMGYYTTNTDGELVEDWAENRRLSLIHDPKLPSSFNSGRWRRGYNSDIIFATNRIAGCCNKIVVLPTSSHWNASEYSYHRANRTFPATIQPEEGKLGEKYAYQLDAAVENITATAE